MSAETTEPSAITADVDARTVRIEWTNGRETTYDFDRLRWACPCATCRGEMGRPGMLDKIERLTPQQTELVDIQQVGRYAIMPIWADGHSTGIYTYNYLADLK